MKKGILVQTVERKPKEGQTKLMASHYLGVHTEASTSGFIDAPPMKSAYLEVGVFNAPIGTPVTFDFDVKTFQGEERIEIVNLRPDVPALKQRIKDLTKYLQELETENK